MMTPDIAHPHGTIAHDSTSDSVEPLPPRFWWLKRLLILSGVLVVALICLRVWWGYEAHRRLMAEIETYRAFALRQ